jgi:hypothetical protein
MKMLGCVLSIEKYGKCYALSSCHIKETADLNKILSIAQSLKFGTKNMDLHCIHFSKSIGKFHKLNFHSEKNNELPVKIINLVCDIPLSFVLKNVSMEMRTPNTA